MPESASLKVRTDTLLTGPLTEFFFPISGWLTATGVVLGVVSARFWLRTPCGAGWLWFALGLLFVLFPHPVIPRAKAVISKAANEPSTVLPLGTTRATALDASFIEVEEIRLKCFTLSPPLLAQSPTEVQSAFQHELH